MAGTILFNEKQRFTQWWLWVILLGTNILIAYGIYSQLISGNVFGSKPTSNMELIIAFAITLIITLSLLGFHLDTQIRDDGVYVKFFPFHLSYKYYPWQDIKKSYVRKYNPVLEYGGWGMRGFGKNCALNISGNQGLQLELEGHKRLVIGTRKPNELSHVLEGRDLN